MFNEVKQKVKERFDEICQNQIHLFTVSPNREKIWELYLAGFTDENRQGNNCNCCKSFIRQWGGIVTFNGLKIQSVWDIEVESAEYSQPIKNICEYIHSLPVTDVFFNDFQGLGTDRNTAHTDSGLITWTHFYVSLDKKFVLKKDSIPTKQGELRDNKTVLERSLKELTVDATETVLELIAQNSLYRGAEFKGMIEEFYKVQKEHKDIPVNKRDNYYWAKSVSISQALCRIRNTSIGTLLIDLSGGRDLDEAVSAFERLVAPSNYKRPNAIVTPRMVEDAKKRLEEMGFMDSLERRLANQGDVNINNILFTDKVNPMSDVFADMSKDVIINPKTLSKTEEITIGDFIKNVIPTTKGLEVLVENSHLNNFVSLLTAVNKDSKSMFKWDNQFSWSYTGGITDSMKEKVKAAGGDLEGLMRFSLKWNEDGKSIVDLDAHCQGSTGHIYYSNKGDRQTGFLDVDMIRPQGVGIENIIFKVPRKGQYKFYVHNFDNSRHNGFECQLEVNGEIFDFTYPKHSTGNVDIVVVDYDGVNFKVTPKLNAKSQLTSKEKWNLKTNQFVKVKSLMLSPNHWENNTGNKHFLFFLDNCVSDENPRPFFNEFLTEELMKEKRVFETMAGKLKVEHSLPQLSGVGFSETQPNHLYVRVEGNFKRVLKVNF